MSNDVVDLILADHRRFEDLFRELRSSGGDRTKALSSLAELLVAHAEAEESEVYPVLRKFVDVDDHEIDHGAEEHTDGHRALLDLLEAGEPGTATWDEKLEKLSETITHHLDEEERTILNEAREVLSQSRRNELGMAFTQARGALLEEGCGRADYIRRLLAPGSSES